MIWRYRFSLFFLIFFLLLVILRLFYWQVVKAGELSDLGRLQYGKYVNVMPKRGEIKASDGFSLAANKINYLVFANPKEIKDKEKNALLLSSFLELDTASISAAFEKDLFWVPLKGEVEDSVKSEIKRLNLDGIGFEQQFSRLYPESSMAASLLGFVGKDENGEQKGYYGIEGFYNRQLKGRSSFAVQIHDAFGRPVLARSSQDTSPVEGRDLILNIDRSIQFIAEKALKDGIERYKAEGGMVGIINPKTGGVLAMATFPSFDPRDYSSYSSNLFKNPFISSLYEPGSTFKSLIMSSALDAGVVEPQTKCNICSGPVSIGGYQIKTWNDKYSSNITMIDVIKNSDNTGMVFAGKSLGLEKLLKYLDSFGIGSQTGIDLEGEIYQPLKPIANWYAIDLATASFGQGISITPIELLSAFSAIANQGKRMEPHVVSKIKTSKNQTIQIEPKLLGKPISEKTAKVMTEILVNAVDKGEAKWAKPKGYRIAGKTGTAQIPIAGHYDADKTIASFIGFAPADDPKFAMLVIVDRPQTSIYGSETAAPIFFDIAQKILSYYEIPPQ